MSNLTLATVSLGTGLAPEIADLFDNVVEWSPELIYDAILFEGGSDIHPSIYNAPNVASHVNDSLSYRDKYEVKAMTHAIEKNKLIIGICRGAQLACALAGGKLVQHVPGHQGSHNARTINDDVFRVSSVHHQQMYPWDVDHDLLAWSDDHKSNVYVGHEIDDVKHKVEPEACFFPKIKALAFQWHPEWKASAGEIDFTINQIKDKLYV